MSSFLSSSRLPRLSLLLFLFILPELATASSPRELVILNWSDYMDPDLIDRFEKKFDVKVRQPFYDNDDNRTDMLVNSDASGYDLVIVDTPSLDIYRKAGWLEPIDTQKIPNYRFIDPRWLESAGESRAYSVPYFWGTLGIAYRSDLLKSPPRRWMDLFRPSEELSGRIGMYRNTVDIVGAALKALGYSINDTDPDHLKEVARLLNEQRPHVATYEYLNLDENSSLVSGKIVAGMFYNSDTLMVAEHNENIEYVLPAEGSSIWVDHFVVLKSSPHKELAWKFLDFINEPANAAQLARFVYGATPNRAAEKLLPQEFLEDPVIYPDPEALKNSEFNRPLPARIVKKRNRIVSELTR